MNQGPYKLFASCPRGMEELLTIEIEHLGGKSTISHDGGVEFLGDASVLFDYILFSRLGSRIFLHLGFSTIPNEKAIYQAFGNVKWSDYLNNNMTFAIKTLFSQEAKKQYSNSIIFSQILKDSIVDNFRKNTGNRPSVDKASPDVQFLQRIEYKNNSTLAILYVDVTGRPLTNRGYRESGHDAPLRENVAAALVEMSGYTGKESFVDPMCGSGTILIESIFKTLNISPRYLYLRGYLERGEIPFSFTKWPLMRQEVKQFDKLAQEALADVRKKINHLPLNHFFVNDIDPKALSITRKHLRKMGIPVGPIHFSNTDATTYCSGTQNGYIICNPPFGERLDEVEKLKKLYYLFGENLKQNYKGHKAFILTSDPDLRKAIGLRTEFRKVVYNGPIECRLLSYHIY